MQIEQVIQIIKEQHYHDFNGRTIDAKTTRDQILFGDPHQECTGIVTCIYPSIDVLRKAAQLKANLVISHESLFWNHGDQQAWLQDNAVYEQKKALMVEHAICVWRDHDYMHAGLDWQGRKVDGIFYGFLRQMGWEHLVQGEIGFPLRLTIPLMSARNLAQQLTERLHLKGIKCLGNTEGMAHELYIPSHINGRDNDKITKIENENIDTVLAMECIDYTVGIYVNDAAELGENKRIYAIGHFNMEEPGMRWFSEEYLPTLFPSLPIYFVQVADLYTYIQKSCSALM